MRNIVIFLYPLSINENFFYRRIFLALFYQNFKVFEVKWLTCFRGIFEHGYFTLVFYLNFWQLTVSSGHWPFCILCQSFLWFIGGGFLRFLRLGSLVKWNDTFKLELGGHTNTSLVLIGTKRVVAQRKREDGLKFWFLVFLRVTTPTSFVGLENHFIWSFMHEADSLVRCRCDITFLKIFTQPLIFHFLDLMVLMNYQEVIEMLLLCQSHL